MNQVADILKAFDALCAEGKPSALVTVIGIEGSAYRRPGASMLIAQDGRTWGGISGGCLERDVARRGRGVIETQTPVICRYDTTDDEQLSAGPATGCRGMVELFIEPLSRSHRGTMDVGARVLRERKILAVAKVVGGSSRSVVSGHAHLTLDAAGNIDGNIDDPGLRGTAKMHLREVMRDGQPRRVHADSGTSETELFLERLAPPQALVIFGAGPDAIPLIRMARMLGWHVTVVGSRRASGTAGRPALADSWHVTPIESPVEGVSLDAESAVVVMTHHFPRDCAILENLPASLRYLGILGPRSRTESLLDEVALKFDSATIHAPIGLNLGAETPEEIALSIVSEIQQVIAKATGGFLRDKDGPIHSNRLGSSDRSHDRTASELIELA